jgi:hypothetical protein
MFRCSFQADQELCTMLLQQAVPEVAGWVGPTMAISLVVVALAFAAIALSTEAALDLTATIRTIRTGAGWFGRIRRLLGGRRRRR